VRKISNNNVPLPVKGPSGKGKESFTKIKVGLRAVPPPSNPDGPEGHPRRRSQSGRGSFVDKRACFNQPSTVEAVEEGRPARHQPAEEDGDRGATDEGVGREVRDKDREPQDGKAGDEQDLDRAGRGASVLREDSLAQRPDGSKVGHARTRLAPMATPGVFAPCGTDRHWF
jgi:hypothetical protein